MRKIDIHRKIGFIHFAIEGGYMKRTLNLILSKTCQINKFLILNWIIFHQPVCISNLMGITAGNNLQFNIGYG